jgi:predicted 2-oxoglutarate/Fe(II)-dependent dioxygenase YbiX
MSRWESLAMIKELLDGEYIFIIRDFCTPQECAAFIAQSEEAGYAEATITTAAGFVMRKDVRDNARLILDDTELAVRLWKRAEPFLPARIRSWQACGFNERFRFYRYDPGQKFAPHWDGCFQRDNGEESQLTFMIYLNDDFTGGETKFYLNDGMPRLEVKPERGMALVFVHQQLHEGAPVLQGRKYVLRTDVMYVPRA